MKILAVFQEIMQRLSQRKGIEDEILFHILDSMAERFVESSDDSEWQYYTPLLDKLDKMWQYGQLDWMSLEQGYLYGGIWGCLSMLSWIQKKKTTSQKCYTMASKYKKDSMFIFLNSIYESPGVQNKELAQRCGVSTARISQISSEALKDGLISARTSGKEKGYYIRTMGERVCDIIERQKYELAADIRSIDYKVISFSNKETDFLRKCKELNALINVWNRNNQIAIAVAIGEKQEETSLIDRLELTDESKPIIPFWYVAGLESTDNSELIGEKENIIWKEMNNLSRNSTNFYNMRKEADMTRLRSYMG